MKGISGLDTLISGPYIEAIPGKSAPPSYAFSGLPGRPLESGPQALKLLLTTDRLGSLSTGAPVYYRQIPVGEVTTFELAETADKVRIGVVIEPHYAPLVRKNSLFYRVSGVNVDFKLTGIKIKSESLTSLISGGIAFATPEGRKMGKPAAQNSTYPLFEEPKEKWLEWNPKIKLGEKKDRNTE